MRGKLFLIVIATIVTMILTAGCMSVTGGATNAKPSHEILRKSRIGTDWQMYQIRIILPPGSSFPILLKLGAGDKVDGYFYLEKGSNVDFGVNADAQVYHSTPNATGNATSDRFSFSTTKELGSTYTLQFTTLPNATDQQVIFLEVVYPARGAIFDPLE